MKKAMRKLIPAVIMLLISAMLVGTSTYAWFSMNRTVTVTGMKVTTTAGSNLYIVSDSLDSVAKKADNLFGTSVDTADAVATVIEPVSTVNGKEFFYTTSAQSNGDATTDSYTAYNANEVPTSGELSSFNSAYGIASGAVGYKDYVFQLKAYNADQVNAKPIKITKLNLIYAGIDTGKAHRVAVLVEDISAGTAAGGSGTLKGIYAPAGAENFSDVSSDNYAISAAGSAPTQLTANYNTVDPIASVPANTTKYYKVVIRLYLEGEDTTCKNDTYASLNGQWELDLEFKIDDATTNTAVSNINKCSSKSVEISATTKTYYYNGTYVWDDRSKVGIDSQGTAAASAPAEVKTAFGIA